MAKINWLASYPKSGNTWMRALLENYLKDPEVPLDINQLSSVPGASARVLFDEWVGIEASALDDAMIERLRPGVYRCLVGDSNNQVYMKVHDRWRRNQEGEALFPEEITTGVIYIIRSPLDLAASTANHYGVDIMKAVDYLCDSQFALARTLGSLADQLKQPLGSWSEHISSWLDESDLQVQLVRYEDLQQNPVDEFEKVVRFLKLPHDKERVRKAVAFASFKELQRQELKAGFRERSVKSSGPFFRRGKVGGWRDELSKDLVERVIQNNAPMMRRFGYLNDNNEAGVYDL